VAVVGVEAGSSAVSVSAVAAVQLRQCSGGSDGGRAAAAAQAVAAQRR